MKTRTQHVELDELSPVGFGCYRVDVRSAQHSDALSHALRSGCNLIDTASNYADGRSEELVGDVLQAHESRAFVVTKAGYVAPSAATELGRAGIDVGKLSRLENGTPYSLDPPVLRVLLDLSRTRLRRPLLDALLLHNPERLVETGASEDELRLTLERAFSFLDTEVAHGRLRYYGVSSNALPTAADGETLQLETLLRLTSHDAKHPFAFVQFPLNLLEREASSGGAKSLIARATGRVRLLANRPLNAAVNGEKIRLALRAPTSDAADCWETCVDHVVARLRELGEASPWTGFRPMQFLRDSRTSIPDPDLVDVIWENQINPFLMTLFNEDPPDAVHEAFSRLARHARAHAEEVLAERTRAAVSSLRADGVIDARSEEPLALTATRYCLDAGADHVLVGMRRREYVDELAPLFARAPVG